MHLPAERNARQDPLQPNDHWRSRRIPGLRYTIRPDQSFPFASPTSFTVQSVYYFSASKSMAETVIELATYATLIFLPGSPVGAHGIEPSAVLDRVATLLSLRVDRVNRAPIRNSHQPGRSFVTATNPLTDLQLQSTLLHCSESFIVPEIQSAYEFH
ncbi:hypothetical protein UFOVP49_63 [uncultured Caudovirales phage]|uniref:Uncharacterized protein n=1 Tax=uncultured Caudovirales phage TaxID=2100421 RepID=A0A6J5KT57_9CAUD|nr:hypothetical protein UFOVP49_63 [uncultured Caudovirales phage]